MAKLGSAETFFAALDGKAPLAPIIGFGGAERVFVDDAIASIRARVLSGGMADFNHDRCSARERRGPEIVSMCKTLPVMAPSRLVEVKDAEALGEADVDAITAYLDAPCPETTLTLVFGEMDLRGKVLKLLDKSPNVLLCRFDHPGERDMPGLVNRRAQKQGARLGPGAADALAMTIGTDLTLLERALEKLQVAVEGEISVDDVSTHVADTHLEDTFAFTRAVAVGDRKAAMKAAALLQASRVEPFPILGALAWQLRLVARARVLLDDGGDVGRELRLFGDRLAPVMKAARAFPPERHAKRLAQLADADISLKSSRQPPWLQLMKLVQELTR